MALTSLSPTCFSTSSPKIPSNKGKTLESRGQLRPPIAKDQMNRPGSHLFLYNSRQATAQISLNRFGNGSTDCVVDRRALPLECRLDTNLDITCDVKGAIRLAEEDQYRVYVPLPCWAITLRSSVSTDFETAELIMLSIYDSKLLAM